jgi:hypothetical protein
LFFFEKGGYLLLREFPSTLWACGVKHISPIEGLYLLVNTLEPVESFAGSSLHGEVPFVRVGKYLLQAIISGNNYEAIIFSSVVYIVVGRSNYL